MQSYPASSVAPWNTLTFSFSNKSGPPSLSPQSATNIYQIINFRTASWNARGPTCKQFAQVAAIMEEQKDKGDEDKVEGGGAERGGCLVSSHKGRSAPLRTQRNQPVTLTRNIHKPPLCEGLEWRRDSGRDLLQDLNGLRNIRKLATRIRANVLQERVWWKMFSGWSDLWRGRVCSWIYDYAKIFIQNLFVC